MENHRLVTKIKQGLKILEAENYDNDLVLPDEFLKAHFRNILNMKVQLSSPVPLASEIITMGACVHMARHLKTMADELECHAAGLGQAEECIAQMKYEEQHRYAGRDS